MSSSSVGQQGGEARLLAAGGGSGDPAAASSSGSDVDPTRISDGITALRYLGNTLLASACWDGCVRVHDTARSKGEDSVAAVISLRSPVLSLAVPVDAATNGGGGGGGATTATTTTTSPVDFDRFDRRRLYEGGGGDDDDDGPYAATSSRGPFLFAGTLDGSVYRLDLFREGEEDDDEEEEEEGAVPAAPASWSLRSTLVGRHGGDGGSDGKRAAKCLSAVCFSVPSSSHQQSKKVERAMRCWVASAGWDGRWCLWDGACTGRNLSSASSASPSPLCGLDLPGKAFDMDACAVLLPPAGADPANPAAGIKMRCAVATSGRRVCFVDAGPSPAAATAKASIVLDRESSLKYQTRTVRFFPGGEGIAVGCIEGRVAIEYLSELGVDPPPDANSSGAAPAKKYAFKCHRRGDLVFPVNCVEFHPGSLCTLATGGGDGAAVLWNGLAKRRLSPLMSCPTSVAALAFHPLGTELAVASSYTFERGPLEASPEEGPPPKDEIYLRALLASEFQPKGGGGG